MMVIETAVGVAVGYAVGRGVYALIVRELMKLWLNIETRRSRKLGFLVRPGPEHAPGWLKALWGAR